MHPSFELSEAHACHVLLVLLFGAEGLINANLGERLDGLLALVDGSLVVLLLGDEDGVLLVAELLRQLYRELELPSTQC